MNTDKVIKTFGGELLKLSHESTVLKTPMKLNVYLPPKPQNAPVIFYLAGLTCTGDNGAEKGNFFGPAAEQNIAIVFPDTSPRTTAELKSSATSEHESWDFGSGAGFYINATQDPWKQHYHMESYITKELPQLLGQHLADLDWSRVSVMGHSMGGHGALTLYLKNPEFYKSVSAFSPIAHPTKCPWGEKAFTNYLGSVGAGVEHDATEIVKKLGEKAPSTTALIDVGLDDGFFKDGQLLPDDLVEAAQNTPFKVDLRKQEGYDHSYFFISTFAKDHIAHHAKYLK